MEINESEDNKLCKPNFSGSLDNLRLADAQGSSNYECINSAEAMLDKLLEKNATPTLSKKEAQNDQSNNGSTSKNIAKDSGEAEKSRSFFHLSDHIKKDLSMLAYPSKSQSRKKGFISSRAISNSRITIAQALEKAEDARKSISNLNITSNKSDEKERDISKLPTQFDSSGEFVDKGDNESQDMMEVLPHSDTLETSRKKRKKMDSPVTSQSVADSSPTATVNESASCSEGNTVLLADKANSAGTSRIQMTRRMGELLKFTFIHENFPSSVNVVRLAKMMGMPWSQVRNWFTDRRVENKKAGIYPRDRPLIDCPYCDVTLHTEAEQKDHLFSTQHVKRILGLEYCGGVTSESIKWKKLPNTVNAVSKVSGARILAVGFSADDFKKGKKVQEKKKMETAVGKAPHSKELKKLWTDAMLLPEEKVQTPPEWKLSRVSVEKNSDRYCEPYMKRKKETAIDLKIRNLKEKAKEHNENAYGRKVVVNSRVLSIPVNVGDIPGTVSDSFPVTLNDATTSNMVAMSSRDSDLVNTGVVSAVMPGDFHIKKSYQIKDTSIISELEVPKKGVFEKKPNIGGLLESPTKSQRHTTLATKVTKKTYRGTVPKSLKSMKPKNKSTSSTSGSPSLSNISRKNKSSKSYILSSQYIQDYELKQELETNKSFKNTITLYKGDASNGQRKCKMSVANANKQPFTINPSSSLCVPNSLKSSPLRKTSSVPYDPSIVRSEGGLAVSKTSRTNVDKRKVKLRTQPLGSVLRANKTTVSAYEGNIIVGYQCPNCNKVYQTEWLMMKHSVTHFKYHCDICYQVYPTENMMKIHLLDHLSGAYEDEKYYCQFSCKICHSLKCGCFEPTYCKPQDLPRIFFRPQKAKRSKKGFISKLNSGPNDHLKISLSSYKKLLLSESLGNTKEKLEKLTSPKPMLIEDVQKILVLKDDKKATSAGDTQISTFVLREAQANIPAETPKIHKLERENEEIINVEEETSDAILTEERGSASIAGISGEQLEVRSNVCTLEEKKLITEREKQVNRTLEEKKLITEREKQVNCTLEEKKLITEGEKQVNCTLEEKKLITEREKQVNLRQIQRKITMNYTDDITPSPQKLCLNKLEETEDAPDTKRAGSRRRTTKPSSNSVYKDTDYYYMCEICDANFTSKAELSEHMFLHRLKSRSRRGEKRGISCETNETQVPKKVKIDGKAVTEAVAGLENHTCEVCLGSFPSIADYRAHKILAHKEPEHKDTEVYRCNYCDKIYRRRRELKRHLKRDCASAPPSLKGKLSALSCSTNMIEESHYTTMKVNLGGKLELPSRFISKGASRGPIVCKYCLAVTKREAEMKRHIWKFCLKVPPEVVQKFMDGASLEELGFKYIREEVSTEASPTDRSQNTDTEVSGTQSDVKDSTNDIQIFKDQDFSEESSPEKCTSLDVKTPVPIELPGTSSTTKYSLQMSPDKKTAISVPTELPEKSSTTKYSLQMSPDKKTAISVPIKLLETSSTTKNSLQMSTDKKTAISVPIELPETSSTTKYSLQMSTDKKIPTVQENISHDSNIEREKTLIVQEDNMEHSNTTKPPLEMESSYVKPVRSEEQSMSTVHAEESEKTVNTEPTEKQSSAKSLSEDTKMEPLYAADEVAEPAASPSLLAIPVIEFPIALPKVISSSKSKRPLVCGYCGIWYFRDMAILKHMKERCIKIPDFDKDILKSSNTLCNVPQKTGGIGISPENEAVYKMVKVTEQLQNTPVPMPKEDIKESPVSMPKEDVKESRLNTNITKPLSESTPIEPKLVNENKNTSSSVSSPVNETRNSPLKRGSRCRRCHEHFSCPEAVLAHSSVHHGPKKGFYKCKLCNARLAKYKQLREHVWEHTDENPYRCHVCQVKYRSSDALVEHLHNQHQYTSINDKNLYKWLPGRHGRYRDIKVKNSNVEEKLDDVDTNLDSHAEVMVITDQDICSNTSRDSKIREDENKVTNKCSGPHKQLDDSKSMKVKSENLKVGSIYDGNSSKNSKSNETKVASTSLDGPRKTDCTVDISEDIISDKTHKLNVGERTTIKESSGKVLCGSPSVKNAAVQEEHENEEQTSPTEPTTCIKSENRLKKKNEVTIVEGVDDKDADPGILDGFTGEGILPIIENLESVVETIQLTDKHLS